MRKVKRISKKRLVLVLILACALFFCLVIRTGYLQLMKGNWLSTKAKCFFTFNNLIIQQSHHQNSLQ
ncbi:hypothetical protein, partial [Clostridioides difficile]|uniref:hypothetical protein n=1 Tax=Clostridioides difficile TaxID=1496 RepID=UPI002FCD86B4